MQFDDRLATVLRMRAGSDAVLRTQFKQLLDLLGTRNEAASNGLKSEAYARLGELMAELPQEDQSRILREPGLRLRNPELVEFLAGGDAKPAAAAMATAQLSEGQWLSLIPDLPVAARGFLRHRRDLPERVRRQLQELGVLDLVLPEPAGGRVAAPAQTPAPTRGKPGTPTEGIGALLRRIEAFRQERATQAGAPRLPLDDDEPEGPVPGFEFVTDTKGTVTWASEPVAPFVAGMRLTSPGTSALLQRDERTATLLASHQPLHADRLVLDAAPAISGDWFCDAAPLFDEQSGGFLGYRGCLRRVLPEPEAIEGDDGEGDAMRQVLHELRTPVNAIQGFAEIIQQQLFGAAPHEYRAHAAAIAVDAAKLLAGFDEVDRLVRLENGALDLEEGISDFRAAVADTVQRLQGVLRPRNAGFVLKVKGDPFHVGLERAEALTLAWRVLATAAGAMGPGETIKVRLASEDGVIRLRMKIPAGLIEGEGDGPSQRHRRRTVSAGMFGPKFTFRLAQAEAHMAGGKLKCKKDRVTLTIPALTEDDSDHSEKAGRAGDKRG